MGFFSYLCPGCGHSIRHRGATKARSRWMCAAVFLDAEGSRIFGEYDGYGRVSHFDVSRDIRDEDSAALYHTICWRILGEPVYSTASMHASDQGHFVGEYDPAQPETMADLKNLRMMASHKEEQDRLASEWFYIGLRLEYVLRGEPVPPWAGL